MSRLLTHAFACALVLCLFGLQNAGRANELPIEILNKVRGATAFIKVTKPGQQARGSGFFVTPEIVVTNAHVIGVRKNDDPLPVKVEVVLGSGTPKESLVVAEVSGVDVPSDLAFLKVPHQASVQSLSLRPSAEINETLPVYILGFPLGESLDRNGRNPSITISSGHVSSLRRDIDDRIVEIQIDGSLIPGNSGGPIIDSQGRLVAVSEATILGLNIGFSIPSDAVQADLAGRVYRGSYEAVPLADGMHSLKASVTTLDPLHRVKRVALYYWTSPLNTKRPVDPQGKFDTYGAPEDSPRKHVELTFDVGEKKWIGEIPKFALKPDEDLWIQSAVARADGVRCIEAVNFGNQLRGKKVKAAQPNSVANSQPDPDFNPNTKPESERSMSPARGALGASRGGADPLPTPGASSGLFDTRKEQDESGNPYTLATSVASTELLGDKKLIQMAVDPEGNRLYAILQDESKVFVFDPTDMSLKEEIAVPRNPVSIWCDAERLIVACSQSRAIVFIDSKTLKPVKSARISASGEWLPQRVVGRTSSGKALTLWTEAGGSDRLVSLYLMSEKGDSTKIFSGDIQWCAIPNKNQLWVQSNFGGSPSGVARLISLNNPKGAEQVGRELFGRTGFTMHRSFGHCFLSSDGKNFIVPTEARNLVPGGEWGYATRTLVARSDLSEIAMEMDGGVICEYPAGDCYVAWKDGRTPRNLDAGPEILYHSRSTGRMIRKILVKNFKPHPAIFTIQPAVPEVVFVPGHELLLVSDRHDAKAKITVIRCGPVDPASEVAADPSLRLTNAPPKLAVVGKPMSFTPSFSRPEGAKSIAFRLAQGVTGMEVDRSTGKLSFTPSDANLGLYDVSIVADVDGTEIPVATWVLEIDLP